MRKVSTFLLIFAGTIFSVFMIGLALYALVPEYHDAIAAAVATSDDIPVVTPDMVKEIPQEKETVDTDNSASYLDSEIADYQSKIVLEDEDVALSGSANKEKEPIVINKEYHEDCGTGKGYWVITYSDGSVVIE